MDRVEEVAGSRPPVTLGPAIKVVALVGLVAAYGMSALLMAAGYLPPTVTWAGVALIPGVMFLAVTSPLFLPVETRRQRWVAIGGGGVCYLIGMMLIYWQGWV